jgi:HD-GYP domain-containing protein (c-di-GMP phosphodiesterase class II)
MNEAVQAALGQIFERWDGKGFPRGHKGDALSMPVRFAHLATQVMAFQPDGYQSVETIVRQRSGGWFDPAIAEAFLQRGRSLLEQVEWADAWMAAVEAEPEPRRCVSEGTLDDLAVAFGDMADLKTYFLRGHSGRVAALAEEGARQMGLPPPEVTCVRRAALFHDVGRVGIPVGVWEKEGPLTATEWEKVRLHAYHTERILSRAPALQTLAPVAGMHHERMDGSGYHRGAAGSSLPLAARLLAAADAYEAMTSERPYRPAMDAGTAAHILEAETQAGRLDREATRAVLEGAGHRQRRPRKSGPAGLSEREIEVLRLIATGATYREVARTLVISPRTAAHHVQHIYDKIGVSTRAAAALFAMEHQLL